MSNQVSYQVLTLNFMTRLYRSSLVTLTGCRLSRET